MSRTATAPDRLYRTIGWRLVPFLFLCYAASYLDRVNIGFAKLQLQDDLQFSETVYGSCAASGRGCGSPGSWSAGR